MKIKLIEIDKTSEILIKIAGVKQEKDLETLCRKHLLLVFHKAWYKIDKTVWEY